VKKIHILLKSKNISLKSMKIPTLLVFTSLLLNLARICISTNAQGQGETVKEGIIPSAENISTNDEPLEGGEADKSLATLNNENDFDDLIDIDSEDFKEIMAKPLTQELIHSNAVFKL
jgi:hypothetical protein